MMPSSFLVAFCQSLNALMEPLMSSSITTHRFDPLPSESVADHAVPALARLSSRFLMTMALVPAGRLLRRLLISGIVTFSSLSENMSCADASLFSTLVTISFFCASDFPITIDC